MSTPCPAFRPGANTHQQMNKRAGTPRRFLLCGAYILNAKIGHPHIKIKRAAHADGRQIRRAVATRTHIVHTATSCNPPQMGDTARMRNSRAI